MRVIVSKLYRIHNITGKQPFQPYKENNVYKKIKYNITVKVDEGLLVHNTLTREMILLEDAEKDIFINSAYHKFNPMVLKYLIEHWFLVPVTVDDETICYLVKSGYKTSKNRNASTGMTSFTIFTTTTCNARCPYCYEYGIRKYSMNDDVAKDVAEYIKRKAQENISIRWFGGEPLCNHSTISSISSRLIRDGVSFTSSIVSNGLLFNIISDDTIINLWKLKSVQITIDGTHDNYNNTKNYVNTNTDPYTTVLDNISRLLNIGIRVIIRLNISNENVDDMIILVDELASRFGRKESFYAYPYPIFEGFGNPPYLPSDDTRVELYNNCIRVNEKIQDCGIGLNHEISHIKTHHCMADSGNSVVILPDGKLSLCQHHNENEMCGSIYDRHITREKEEEWSRQTADIPECHGCFYHPICYRLDKCPNEVQCSIGERNYIQYKARLAMLYSYNKWKSNHTNGENHKR